MNKRTKIVLITTIVIIFALIIGYFIRHSYANDNTNTHVSSDNTTVKKKDIKTSNKSVITTSNDDDYIYFDVEIKDKQNDEPYYLDAKVNMSKLWESTLGKTIKAVIEKSADNNNFTMVKEETITLNTDKYLTNQLELTDTRTYFRVSLKANDEAIKITDKNVDIDLDIKADLIYNYDYTGSEQEFSAPVDGDYNIELWGAQGGSGSGNGGKGAYVAGSINLNDNEQIYVYVGQNSNYTSSSCYETNPNNTFNGSEEGGCATGGGATDIRLVSSFNWFDEESLASRIMVAAAGGGAYYNGNGGYGGTLTGGNGSGTSGTSGHYAGSGATQLQYTFGRATGGTSHGGSGYYGGQGGSGGNGGGGSSYISGHTGCVAIISATDITSKSGCSNETTDVECSYHYSGKKFTDTIMKAGNEIMPSHDGASTMTGNSGNGYAKITLSSETKVTKEGKMVLDVTFLKEDEISGAPINGAKFRLWGTSDDGDTVDKTATSTSGRVTFKNVPVGEYSLKEIKAPTGYKLDTKTYTVEVGGRS